MKKSNDSKTNGSEKKELKAKEEKKCEQLKQDINGLVRELSKRIYNQDSRTYSPGVIAYSERDRIIHMTENMKFNNTQLKGLYDQLEKAYKKK